MKSFFVSLLFITSNLFAQQKTNTEEIVRRVANHVIDNTSFQFINNATHEKFSSTKGMDTSSDVRAESSYNKWTYVNGVLNVGMVELSHVLNDKKYADYSKKNFDSSSAILIISKSFMMLKRKQNGLIFSAWEI